MNSAKFVSRVLILYRNHACSPAPQLVCIFFGEISPECHPERGSACTTESKFCGAEQREAKQNRERDERQRAAGSRIGFLNVCSVSVTFTNGHFIPQKFDSVLRTPLRMTLGVKDTLSFHVKTHRLQCKRWVWIFRLCVILISM